MRDAIAARLPTLSAPRDPPGAILCAVNLPRDIEVKLRNGLWDGSGNIGVGVGGFARTPRSRRTQSRTVLRLIPELLNE